ncbi:MAG: hypothetical protein AABZ28_04610 [Nitrospinota bacterium]
MTGLAVRIEAALVVRGVSAPVQMAVIKYFEMFDLEVEPSESVVKTQYQKKQIG